MRTMRRAITGGAIAMLLMLGTGGQAFAGGTVGVGETLTLRAGSCSATARVVTNSTIIPGEATYIKLGSLSSSRCYLSEREYWRESANAPLRVRTFLITPRRQSNGKWYYGTSGSGGSVYYRVRSDFSLCVNPESGPCDSGSVIRG